MQLPLLPTPLLFAMGYNGLKGHASDHREFSESLEKIYNIP